MPLKTDPDWVTPSLVVCNGRVPPEANTIIYANQWTVDEWVSILRGYLAEGRIVAIVGKTARAVADRYIEKG